MTLNGTLEDFSPAGILKVLSADARTGAVRFGGSHGCTVYLHRGQLYFARNHRTDEALATALVRPGRLSADDWADAIDDAGDRPMVGELLVRHGAIAPDLLASVVLSVVYDPLIELFREGTGEFDFEPDTVHWLGPFRAFPVDAIVDEVRKRVREVDEWSSDIPDLGVWVEATRTLPGNAAQVTILREDWELVTALSGPRTIDELAGELGRGSYSTARVVHRLQTAGLVEVSTSDGHADVVPIRRPVAEDTELTVGLETEVDPLLAMGLPHRARSHMDADETAPAESDALDSHIGSTIAEALSQDDTSDEPEAADPGPVATLVPTATPEGQPETETQTEDQTEDQAASVDPDPTSTDEPIEQATPAVDLLEADEDIFVKKDSPLEAVDHDKPGDPLDPHRWDESRLVGNGGALHHEDLTATPLDEPRPDDPNAAWLADLYSQFIDEPETAGNTKKRRRGEPNPVDVAFKSSEQDGEAKVSTLKRLMSALKKL